MRLPHRESPRYPFEVEATIQGFSLRADGDEEFFPSTTIKYSVGDGQLPKGAFVCCGRCVGGVRLLGMARGRVLRHVFGLALSGGRGAHAHAMGSWGTAGLEEGINNMCLNEKAWIRCMSDRYQTSTAVVPGVPSAASAPDGILYIVTLHYFMQVRNAEALPDATV
jgi:hypothetical protein